MTKSGNSHGDPATDGQMWTFMNDIRVVGELTSVCCTIASGAIVEGWATITAYRSCMTEGAIPGMCVAGPVFDTAKRGCVLDLHPVFSRLERIITALPLFGPPTPE